MANDSLSALTKLVLDFRTARDWKQFHTPKELAISLVVEAAELLEIFQWKQGEELNQAVAKRRTEIADELADCLHSILLLAHDLKIDPAEALAEKMRKMEAKYPVAKARGKPNKYNELD
ncbi:MAG TPA: nucleotide pyrophosphohydrolase [Tepidisphaeraceae bacterium]|jgi:NTP pyrophosphatase (non-canonical NTP hydrolase)|nr:nucleotide pyrophosphohydrolase [Tepidisphaeraceae bacterium]